MPEPVFRLIQVIPTSILPVDWLNSVEEIQILFTRTLVTHFSDVALTPGPGGRTEIGLSWDSECVLNLPGLNGFALVLGGSSSDTLIVGVEETGTSSRFVFRGVIRLRFPRSWLHPVIEQDRRWIDDPERRHSELSYSAGVIVDQNWNVHFDGSDAIELRSAMIADTGFVIEGRVAVDFSETESLPETLAMGLGTAWRGVIFRTLALHLPRDLNVSILPSELRLTNFHIGSGGLSGSISGQWMPEVSGNRISGSGAGSLFGFSFGLKRLELSLLQNSFNGLEFKGKLGLPFFDHVLDVDLGIDLDGKFSVTLDSPTGILRLRREGILDLEIASISFAEENGVFTAKVSGTVKPLIAGFDWPAFQVRELAIDSNGNVRLEGGWLNLRQQYTLSLGAFRLEITRLGFGGNEDGGKWIGFSGGLRLIDGVRAGASVEGLRITWYEDEPGPTARTPRLTLNGVGVEFEVPNVLRLQGSISYDDALQRFTGSITLHLISLNLRANAILVFGTGTSPQGPYTYMGIYLAIDLPAGIPLWSTGLALYGIAGLFALHMEPNKLPDEQWYNIARTNSYYHRDPVGVTDLIRKWTNQQGSLALGAGVTVGTLPDNGFTFSGRLLLAIVFPGPIVMIEGKASLLAQRSTLNDEPNFRALAVLDNRAGTFLIGLDAQYKYDRTNGRLINVRGGAEAYFNFSDANAWHVYVGERDPREKRIRARIFSLFEASAYLMLDAQQLAFGVRVGYEGRWTFGPVTVTLEAWIECNAALSWSPTHFHGDLALHARFELRIFGIGLTLAADASIAADVFDPYHIVVHLLLEIRLFPPIPTLRPEITLEWGPLPVPPPLPLPLKEIAIEHFKVTTSWPLPRGTLLVPNYERDHGSGLLLDMPPTFDENAAPVGGLPEVPLDCRPHVTFAHPVHDDAMIGVNPQPPEPARERIGDPAHNEGPVLVRYGLQGITLEKWDDNARRWVMVGRTVSELIPGTDPPRWRLTSNPEGVRPLFGSWAPVPRTPDHGGGSPAQVKLWLWSKTPFDYTRPTETSWDEWFTDRFAGYPCVPISSDREICCDFERFENGRQLTSPWRCPEQPTLTLSWSGPASAPVTIVSEPLAGFTHAFSFPTNELTIVLPEPSRAVRFVIQDEQGVEAWGVNGSGRVFGPFPGGHRAVLEVIGEDMVRVIVRGVFQTRLFRICVVVGPDPSEAIQREEMARHLRDEMARWNQEDDVLEPQTTYRLKVLTTVRAQGDAELAGWSRNTSQTEYAFFRTSRPPALASFSTPAGQPEGVAFDSGLNDLTCYVRQTVPATVPAKGEKPTLPRPIYRAYDVGVEFNENYVELMYRLEGRDLGLYLYDNNNRPVRDAQGRLVTLTNQWGRLEELTLTESERRWIRMVNTSTCAALSAWDIPRAARLSTANEALVLEADTIYEARLTPLLLHEDFRKYETGMFVSGSGSTLNGWSVVDQGSSAGPSRWEIGEERGNRFIIQTTNIFGGTLDGRDPVKPGTMLVRGDTEWNDYRLTVYLGSADNDAVGVVFRYRDEENYYRFSLDSERRYRRLVRVFKGAHTILAEDDFVYQLNHDYKIGIEAVGQELRVFQDGVLVFETTDASIASGQIGLYCWGNVNARFSEVLVDDLRPRAPVAYRFKFTTSQFANFFHHLHSFQDESWRAAPTAAALPDATFSQLGGRAVPITTAFSEGEARAYEELATAVLDDAAQQTPKEVQVNWIERNDARVALLIRSPEPIDWQRTTVTLQRADRLLPPPEVPTDIKLTGVTFGESQPNEELVTLLLRAPADLTRHRIELRRLPSALSEPAGDTLLFVDEFDGPLEQWTIIDEDKESLPSVWRVTGGALLQTTSTGSALSLGSPGTYAVSGDRSWTDYRLIVRLRSDDNGAIGLLFRYQDENNYYRLSFDAARSSRRLSRKASGVWTTLWEDPSSYRVGEPFTLTVEAIGSRLGGYVGAVRLFEIVDPTHAAGQVGLYCCANRGARFESVEVQRPLLEAYALLRDHFAEGHLLGWRTEDEGDIDSPSDWRISEGTLRQSSNIHSLPDNRTALGKPGTQLITGEVAWTDVVLSTRVQSSTGAIGLLFRYVDANNYYRFSMNREHGYRRLVKKVSGRVTVLWEDATTYEAERIYELTIVAADNSLRGYVDGLLMFAVEDDALANGQVGLYCWKNASATFSQVRVFPTHLSFHDWLLEEPFDLLLPDRWTFVDEGDREGPSHWEVRDGELRQSSRIQGGSPERNATDKPGTYALAGDSAWTDYRIITRLRSDTAEGALGVMFRYVDANNYYRFSMDVKRRYRRLIKKVAGRVNVLWEDAIAYKKGREYILTLDCVGDRLSGYLNGVKLFSVTDGDLSGGKIALYCWAQRGARFAEVLVCAPLWVNYYNFGREARLPAGTRVHVYAGNPADEPPPQAGIVQRFVCSLDERGQLRLSSSGAELRVRAPGKENGHSRSFLPDDAYATENAMMLRRTDGTGCFLFRPSLAPHASGQYRLAMTYRRDNRATQPDSQVLSEFGNKQPEHVILDIPWQVAR